MRCLSSLLLLCAAAVCGPAIAAPPPTRGAPAPPVSRPKVELEFVAPDGLAGRLVVEAPSLRPPPPHGAVKGRVVGVPADPPGGRADFVRGDELHWLPLPDGRVAAHFGLRSAGAQALRLAVVSGTGAATLRVRGATRGEPVRGPVAVGSSPTWTPLTRGDAVEVEVIADRPDATLRVTQLVHYGDGPRRRPRSKGIGDAGACQVDRACTTLSEFGLGASRASVMVEFISDGYGYVCSGVVTITRNATFVPYVLTSSVCIESAAEAATVEIWWFFDAPFCRAGFASGEVVQSGGSTLLVRDPEQGFSFIVLATDVPDGAWFSGWDPAGPQVGQTVHAFHHPEGDLKKVNIGAVSTRDAFAEVRFSTGVNEPGSVGSGLFRDQAYLVGLEWGGYSECADPTAPDYYANFNGIYTALADYFEDRVTPSPARATNYSDIWWNPNESGWGLTLADHETQMFGVWYTYDAGGRPTWYSIPGGTFRENRRYFDGDLYISTGPSYTTAFDPRLVTTTRAGTARLDFAPPGVAPGRALYTYTVGAVTHTKEIERVPFGDAAPDWGNDYTDIYWDSTQSGWGLALAQHGANVFGVWYTYDTNGAPLFAFVPGGRFTTPYDFVGDLYTSTGPHFATQPFDPSRVRVTLSGDATLTFEPPPAAAARKAFFPKRGTFRPRLRGYVQQKTIAQVPFGNAAPAVAAPPLTFLVTVRLAGTGAGVVTSNPAGIVCPGAACAASFPNGTLVTLTAAPNSVSVFGGFTGTCSTPQTVCTLRATAPITVTATFNAASGPPDPGQPRNCTGTYTAHVNVAGICNSANTLTANGTMTINGINYSAPGPFATTVAIGNAPVNVAGAPDNCALVRQNVVVPFNGTHNGTLGNATFAVGDANFTTQFTIGAQNTVMGTFTSDLGDTGQFTCTY